MSNLAVRILSTIVAVPVLAALVLWSERRAFGAFVALAVALGLVEYVGMTLRERPRGERGTVVGVGTALFLALYLRPDLGAVWAAAAVMALGVGFLLQPGDIPGVAARLGLASFGVFYVAGLLTPLALLQRDVAQGPFWVLAAIAVTFANDSGGYFAGRAFGRHKLYPVVSPAKTWEGAVGGLVFALVFMFLARATFFGTLTTTDCLLVAVPASLLGPAGDLVESMLKRSAGVKDSGRLIPGHGGLLDRIDAVLFVGTWVWAYAAHIR